MNSKANNSVLLEVKGLHKEYDGQTALDMIDLSVHKGEVVVVLGPSGCGKSTLLRCLNGLEAIQGGDIVFDGTSLNRKAIKWRKFVRRLAWYFKTMIFFLI
jgi:polar amino acid transport system ATP-binding protein